MSPNSTPANCCDDHRHLPVLSPKDYSEIVELPLVDCQDAQVISSESPLAREGVHDRTDGAIRPPYSG
jgi:hypothetical protein